MYGINHIRSDSHVTRRHPSWSTPDTPFEVESPTPPPPPLCSGRGVRRIGRESSATFSSGRGSRNLYSCSYGLLSPSISCKTKVFLMSVRSQPSRDASATVSGVALDPSRRELSTGRPGTTLSGTRRPIRRQTKSVRWWVKRRLSNFFF